MITLSAEWVRAAYYIVPISGVMVVVARALKYIQILTEKGGRK